MKKLFALLLTIVLVLSLAACGEDKPKKAEAEAPGSETAQTAEAGTTQTAEAESWPEAAEDVKYRVGDALQTHGLKIVYTGSGEHLSDNQFIQPDEGNKFIFISLYFENSFDSDKSVTAFDFHCYADGYDVEQHYAGDDQLSATLSPGRKTMGNLYFEVPAEAKEIEIEYEPGLFSNERITFLYEGEQSADFVPETEASATADALTVGADVETNGLRLTYLSCGPYVSDNQFIQPDEGKEYVFIELEAENISDSDKSISSLSFRAYADGMSCDSKFLGEETLSASLSPGRKSKGSLVFEVPKDAQIIEIEYEGGLFSSDRTVFAYQK